MKIILTIGTQELKSYDISEKFMEEWPELSAEENYKKREQTIKHLVDYLKYKHRELFNKSGVRVWISFESKMNHHYDKAE